MCSRGIHLAGALGDGSDASRARRLHVFFCIRRTECIGSCLHLCVLHAPAKDLAHRAEMLRCLSRTNPMKQSNASIQYRPNVGADLSRTPPIYRPPSCLGIHPYSERLALTTTILCTPPPASRLFSISKSALMTLRSVSRFQWQFPATLFVTGVITFCNR